MAIKVGCCGWAVRGGRRAYFREFSLIELQSTFYKLPRLKTAIKWKQEAPEDFEYTLKAWQALTHSPRSPTWRRGGPKVPPGKADRYGLLRPTEENIQAWEKTLEICKALDSHICVFQSPPSFRPSDENVSNMKAFFTTISRNGVNIAWEPRGKWHERPDLIAKLCNELDLIHVVDLLKRWPLSSQEIAYVRLHGLNGEVNYRYKYTDRDLTTLADRVEKLSHEKTHIYILFNNIYMADDAKKFLLIARDRGIVN